MADYEVVFVRSASRELRALDEGRAQVILLRISGLASDPRPHGCRKLQGTADQLWRIRIGDFRVIYAIDDRRRLVEVFAVRHRRDAYR